MTWTDAEFCFKSRIITGIIVNFTIIYFNTKNAIDSNTNLKNQFHDDALNKILHQLEEFWQSAGFI